MFKSGKKLGDCVAAIIATTVNKQGRRYHEQKVGLIAHKSTRHELDIKNYTQQRVETAWGDASLVVAEQLLRT